MNGGFLSLTSVRLASGPDTSTSQTFHGVMTLKWMVGFWCQDTRHQQSLHPLSSLFCSISNMVVWCHNFDF